jgi:HAD superfamily hydrolase (TIGR01549 family)
MIKAVTFDLGNTLLRQDNLEWSRLERAGLLNHISLFEKRNLKKPNFKEWTSLFYKLNTLFEDVVKVHEIEIPLDKIFKIMLEFYQIPTDIHPESMVRSFCQPLADARVMFDDTLDVLKILKNSRVPLGIISNTYVPGTIVREVLERLRILSYFDFVFFSSDYVFRKPHFVMFEAVLRHWNLRPSQVLHVGDQPDRDVAGAGNVGFKTIWIHRGRPKKGTSKIKPDAEINSLSELPALIKKIK